MKISLSWIFDHIDARWKKQNVDDIVSKFNQTTAEIENYEKIKLDLKPFFMGRVISHDKKETISTGHRLRPRYISYTDGNFKDVAAVLNKMDELFRRNKNNQRWRV